MKQAPKETEKATDELQRAVKGQVKIRVVNRTSDTMSLSASIGGQRLNVLPGKTGIITKANIGDSVEIYASGG